MCGDYFKIKLIYLIFKHVLFFLMFIKFDGFKKSDLVERDSIFLLFLVEEYAYRIFTVLYLLKRYKWNSGRNC